MISVEEATARLLALVEPLDAEEVPLERANGRVLRREVRARHAQPPFAASAMDGYAIATDAPRAGDRFRVIGEVAAGHPFDGTLSGDATVRIFTGAAVPEGARRVVMQEDVAPDGDGIVLRCDVGTARHIRPRGGDFSADAVLSASRRLNSRDIALIAAMGHRSVQVSRRPTVAILMTGDELCQPGSDLRPGQITASNGYGLAAMVGSLGCTPRLLPIARDRGDSLRLALDLSAGCDLLVTIGGASVGDHDLVAETMAGAGMDLSFHKVAMRPGKPLLAGRIGASAVLGLPGNPVSAMVCGVIFMSPMLERMQGLPHLPQVETLSLTAPLPANGPRAHYMRGRRTNGGCEAEDRQDSSLLSVLARSDVLIRRPPNDPALAAGDPVDVIPLPR
ncbi:molybdopterin molybdotransferase MoeA [Jannaschia sp. S6380]|uniref:molybdopterin molybdotransferase MoeA n=1 Tax=Jannaschia sp. S6380 TaxID=2926408 RepID=UPI001FF3861E|nr:molybdopterin molybdotransferase MoeA [Jannaschia sp. S6380]